MANEGLAQLKAFLAKFDSAGIAVSGGVDSMTLGVAAHRYMIGSVRIFHAVSPAVPAEATDRVRKYAEQEGWNLDVFDAGEFSDDEYRKNPVNRCFYCKKGLYGTIAARTRLDIFSGTNLDDLNEYRPGLDAAQRYGVLHPFVEAGVDKQGVRAIARQLELWDVADLPAAPCLSSRVETGLAIQPDILAAVHRAEKLIAQNLFPQVVRCRFRATGVVIELDRDTLSRTDGIVRRHLQHEIADLFGRTVEPDDVTFGGYMSGSAFVGAKP